MRLLLLLPLTLALRLQDRAEWPTYHGGYSLEGVGETAPPDQPEVVWKFKAGQRIDQPPIAGGGRIYFGTSKGTLYALDPSGTQVWKADTGVTTALVYADGAVIGGAKSGSLVAVDAANGTEKWRYEAGGTVQGTPNRVDLSDGKKGIAIISQTDGCIHCVDFDSGKLAWKSPPVERCDGSAGVGGGRLVMGSCAAALHVYSLKKAEKIADVPLGGDCQVAGGVALSGDVAFAGSRSGKFFAVDVAAGKILWTSADAQSEAFTTPAIGESVIVFGSEDGKVYGLDRKTGAKKWAFDAVRSPLSPAIAGNRAVVSADGKLFLLDLQTGAKIWSAAVSDDITSPALVGGRILVGADDGTVIAYGRK